MQTIEQLLAEAPAFDGMREDHLALIAGCASNQVFEPGDFLMREGESSEPLLRHSQGTRGARDLRARTAAP